MAVSLFAAFAPPCMPHLLCSLLVCYATRDWTLCAACVLFELASTANIIVDGDGRSL
jgi:hypothetical protein